MTGETRDFEVDEVFPSIEVHRHENLAALYVNGRLEYSGEEYVVIEKALDRAGVALVTDGAFTRGDADTLASTLDEVEEYRQQRDRDRQQVIEYRAHAASLVAKAEALEDRHRGSR